MHFVLIPDYQSRDTMARQEKNEDNGI